ncbi:hypothetical protein NDU88_007008 [Pleurodeles waltl]|uniref:Uncharacterized protein n=1 Tax=Pleurodeles waltl TaxID=8319 RepID=A0AAV7MDV9_PLEWA|nr:hypothetical protein NDU88_007008 [Pleurodeles waltl]
MRPLTWVAVCEQRADGEQDLGDGQGRAPVVLQDVQADHPLAVDVTVVDPRPERDLCVEKKVSLTSNLSNKQYTGWRLLRPGPGR